MTLTQSARASLAALLALLVSPVLGGCFLGFSSRATRTEQMSYRLGPAALVELSSFGGRLEVRVGDGPLARIERTITCRARTQADADAGLDLVRPDVVSQENQLSVKVEKPRSASHHFQVDLSAEVPPGSRLVLRTENGAVEVMGIEGDIDVRTTNGEVVVRDAGSREVRLITSNGRIVAERIRGALTASSSNGKIVVRDSPGPIQATTGNGLVEVDASSGVAPGGIAVETSNGEVRFLLPGNFSGEIDARTSNGSVACQFPVAAVRGAVGKSRLRGRIGDGGPLLKISTSNGAVHIRRTDDAAPEWKGEEPKPPVLIPEGPRKV